MVKKNRIRIPLFYEKTLQTSALEGILNIGSQSIDMGKSMRGKGK